MYIVIIGCGRLGATLAAELSDSGHDVSVLDRDAARLGILGSGFNGLRLKGIEFDNDNLVEAGIKQADFVLSVTPDDNINITVSLIAKKNFNVPRIIARINDPGKKSVYEMLGIETINPTELSAYILKSRIEETPV
ncbi:MAG: TrkA family potassium uptake protein [Bacillota bacterium]|nr:TrkA family potassium uptake protein [Bacillota bacterium]